MIVTHRDSEGRLYVLLQRCNDWEDHKDPFFQGRDGDILLSSAGGTLDDRNAEELIRRLHRHLRTFPAHSAVKPQKKVAQK